MTRLLKHIGKQLMIFALIASVFNFYALEIWCGLTMATSNHLPGTEKHLAGTDHASGKMADCPHQSNSKPTENSCEDHHDFFATSVSEAGLQKLFAHAGAFNFIRPYHFSLAAARPFSQVTLPVNLFPDVGLRPKVPDIRIYICSLTI